MAPVSAAPRRCGGQHSRNADAMMCAHVAATRSGRMFIHSVDHVRGGVGRAVAAGRRQGLAASGKGGTLTYLSRHSQWGSQGAPRSCTWKACIEHARASVRMSMVLV